jgi:DNA gyrase subunit A
MMITNEGTIIRTSVSGINVYSRTATGVILMRLAEGSYINNVARIEKSEDIEAEGARLNEELSAEEKSQPKAAERQELTSDEDSF